MKKFLITGGCGFIGSNFIRFILKHTKEIEITNLDKLTYAGNPWNLADIENDGRYKFVKGDICDEKAVDKIVSSGVDAIINFAAETHVDRSLYDPASFINTNVLGAYVLFEAAKKHSVKKFLQVSTDEVYGSIEKGYFKEESPISPSSPYAASKAGADALAIAYYKTFNLPVVITRSSNNYGPYQFPEKVIPLFVTNALGNDKLPLYGDGLNKRDWIFVEDNCDGIYKALEKGKPGEVYNLGGGNEIANIDLTKIVLKILDKPQSLIKYVKDRPGHDSRYAIDSSKARKELGWSPKTSFDEGLKITIDWYKNNVAWVEKVKTGEYSKFYQKHYTALDK